MRRALSETVNGLVAKAPKSRSFSDFTMDYQVVPGGLQVTQQYVSVVFDGTFHRSD